jgi:ATP-binding cassette subfamily A (ABC1) protein 1
VQFVVREKENNRNAKHQQMISGVSIPAYWLSNFVWDFLMYLAPFTLAIILLAAFDIPAFTGTGCEVACIDQPLGAVAVLLLTFGLAVIPFTYCLSYLFVESAKAQTFTLMISIFSGLILMIAVFVMRLIPSTCQINRDLMFVYRMVPLFSLGNGLLNIANGVLTLQAGDCYDIEDDFGGIQDTYDPFMLEIIGYEVIYLSCSAIFYMLLAIGIDYLRANPELATKIFSDPKVVDAPYDVDSDVESEKQRVLSGRADDDMIVIKGLRKVYGGSGKPKVAVRDLTFAIPKGECFGFLGINGAGKTTSLKILSGDYIPTAGTATLGGYDIKKQQIECRRLIGYCPQFDSLLDLLTVREHLEMFARIKGVPANVQEEVVSDKIKQMDLTNFENKLAGSLSGGNKRKLSVGIALIGAPPIVFLDEPSTGMDPVARRFMWDVIASVSTTKKECSVSLTTHSMEECEALCTRLGIMVGGRMRCLGGPQHLKNKFGKGLQMEVKLGATKKNAVTELANKLPGGATGAVLPSALQAACEALGNSVRYSWCTLEDEKGWLVAEQMKRHKKLKNMAFCEWWIGEDRAQELLDFMAEKFQAECVERHGDQFRFSVGNLDHTLAEIFSEMEMAKSVQNISSYSVSQTTLEQIFNQFASQQEEEVGTTRGITKNDAKLQRQLSGYSELQTGPGIDGPEATASTPADVVVSGNTKV